MNCINYHQVIAVTKSERQSFLRRILQKSFILIDQIKIAYLTVMDVTEFSIFRSIFNIQEKLFIQ